MNNKEDNKRKREEVPLTWIDGQEEDHFQLQVQYQYTMEEDDIQLIICGQNDMLPKPKTNQINTWRWGVGEVVNKPDHVLLQQQKNDPIQAIQDQN